LFLVFEQSGASRAEILVFQQSGKSALTGSWSSLMAQPEDMWRFSDKKARKRGKIFKDA
jgi:hypothetical protein